MDNIPDSPMRVCIEFMDRLYFESLDLISCPGDKDDVHVTCHEWVDYFIPLMPHPDDVPF